MLLSLVITAIALLVIVWLFDRYILPVIPGKWLKWIVAIAAAILIIWIASTFVKF